MTEIIDYSENYLANLFDHLNIRTSYDIRFEENVLNISIEGPRLNLLIGKRGGNLSSLQYFISQSIYRQFGDWYIVNLDVNGYKKARQEKVELIARNHIDKVRFFKEPVEMSPMVPLERKYIHDFVNGYDDVTSASIGEGPDRRVVISLKE